MAADSYRRQVLKDWEDAEIKAKLDAAQATQANSKFEALSRGILKQDQENKLSGFAIDTKSKYLEFSNIRSKIEACEAKLQNENFEPGETAKLVQSDLTRYNAEAVRSQNEFNDSGRNLFEYIMEVRKSDSFDWF